MSEDEPRVGLALSGGGFRAAFFHVGVLARLAEVNLLGHVQVISTVSGGSIVGALYYVLLKKKAPNGNLNDSQYCALVHDVESRLLTAVQKNIRARVFANPFQNLHMAGRKYSRSDRIGELYDRFLYRPAWGKRGRNWWGGRKLVELRELGPSADPELLINATTLNTGHNWRFDVEGMGEPVPDGPAAEVIREVDTNERLARAWFRSTDLPKKQQGFPLGLAVAASACVPGIFHPLAVSDVYTGRRVQLVDGGVQDNQGVQALFDRDCSHLIISDASSQMPDLKKPAVRTPAVVTRSLAIANDRIRDEQLVHSHTSSGNLDPVLMHLRKGLPSQIVQPRGSDNAGSPQVGGQTTRGVHLEVQKYLARMRTDLDYVSEYEAYSLGLCGYLMTAQELEKSPHLALPGVTLDKPHLSAEWDFAGVERLLSAEPKGSYRRHMEAAGSRFLRAFRMFPEGPAVAFLFATWLAAALILLLGWQVRDHIVDLFTAEWSSLVVLAVAAGCGAMIGLYAATARFQLTRVPSSFFFGFLLPIAATVPMLLWSWSQLLAKPLMLRLGRVPKASSEGREEVRGAQLSTE